MSDVGERVEEITAQTLGIESALVMDLEDEFNIEISDLEASDIITVEQATTFIMERLNG